MWPQRSLNVTKVHPILALIQPFPIGWSDDVFPSKLCVSLSFSILLSLSISFSLPLSFSYFLSICSMQTFIYIERNIFIKWSMILKVTWDHFYVAWFSNILRSFDQITTLTYIHMDNFFLISSNKGLPSILERDIMIRPINFIFCLENLTLEFK